MAARGESQRYERANRKDPEYFAVRRRSGVFKRIYLAPILSSVTLPYTTTNPYGQRARRAPEAAAKESAVDPQAKGKRSERRRSPEGVQRGWEQRVDGELAFVMVEAQGAQTSAQLLSTMRYIARNDVGTRQGKTGKPEVPTYPQLNNQHAMSESIGKLTDRKVLIFDVYGTLMDWESGIYNALRPLLSKFPASKNWSRKEALLP
ncbi:hypothetical protein NMY22_g6794 [Coprinellus aureogranulatus]|nr:hypothetical protein NMY22_g6794 [Coprinellus aureogranulatus]